MTGYTRADSVNNIADGNIINASDLDGEFDAVQAAFNSSTGHVHDGTAANGAPITKIGPTQDVVASATALTPKTTATVDVGSSALKFKDFFFSGTGTLVGLTATGAITLNTTTDNQSYTTTGAGTITISSGTAGSINNMNIGATTAGTGKFSSITNTGLTSGRVVFSTTGGLETDSANLTFDGTNLTLAGGTANGVTYLNGSKVLTSGSSFVFDGTNVGIGTSSPGVKLQVGDGTASTLSWVVGSSSGTGGGSYFAVKNGSTFIAALGNYSALLGGTYSASPVMYFTGGLQFSEAGAERMRIDSSGNVGIATTIQKAKLQVNPGNVSTVGAIASSGLMIENFSGVGNLSQIGFGYATSALVNTTAYIGLIETNAAGASYGDLIFGTRNVTTDTAPTERMRIDSSGNVGIGATPSAWNSAYKALDISAWGAIVGEFTTQGSTTVATNCYANSTGYNNWTFKNNAWATRYKQNDGIHSWLTSTASGTAGTAVTFSEMMRIDSSGNLLVGTTSVLNTSKFSLAGNFALSGTQMNMAPGADFEFVQRSAFKMLFYVNAATVVANLSITGVWTNASDARYKENITDSPYGLATVMALKPRAYNLINLEDKPQIGFIAQEVIDIVPEVVESVHNSVTNEDRYTLSYGNMVAVLTKAIQEQQALIVSLTARIEALEST